MRYTTESTISLRPCAGNKFCVNTEGSFRCMRCDKSCDGCDGDGPDNCAKCADGYVKNKVRFYFRGLFDKTVGNSSVQA